MIKKGTTIEITKSKDLVASGLEALVGRVGTITEDLSDPSRKFRGCYVRLAEGRFLEEDEWFIPIASIKEYNR